ncbi:tyrosine-protein phosphatase [Pedobacter sp. P26]|uniref:tyrosine-protein phosphatase n=1 Tax=Pedobacter sp. P26 TaxID=3423956 RepID=UPI003D6736E1
MFSIFKKELPLVTDVNWLSVDIHSHLLPGIDDGARDLNESISYIKSLQSLGYEKLLCTPHVFTELYPNNADTILLALGQVEAAIRTEKISLAVGAAAEYMIDENFRITDELICLPGKHILIEMSYLNETPNIEQVIFDLQIKGYIVILAHPERYNFYHGVPQRYQRLIDIGCLFQLNLLSIIGYYGKEVKHAAEYLIKKDFIA